MSNEFRSLVSIVIPVYNGANYLREAIDSALAQTYENCEIIVVNDGSNDGGETERIALSYGDKICYFHKENGGVATALNMGIENMRGEYFSWLSHDDMYLPNKIEKQIASISTGFSKPTISICNVTKINEKRETVGTAIVDARIKNYLRCFLAFDTDIGINGCALLIPKSLFNVCGKFNHSLLLTQDYDMWFRMAPFAEFAIVPDMLVISRIHAEQGSKKQYADIALQACDKLHDSFISSLAPDEIKSYCRNDYSCLFHYYQVRKANGYYLTASSILRLLIHKYLFDGDNHAAIKLLKAELFNNDRNQANKLAKLMSKTINNPRIAIFQEAWMVGGVERVCTTLTNHLANKYEFMVIKGNEYPETDIFDLPENVKIISIDFHNDFLFKLIAVLKLTDVSVFIGNSNWKNDYLLIYSQLKDTKIKSIAWNHYHFFLPQFHKSLYSQMINRTQYLKDANVSVWLTSYSANAYRLQADNAALMPNPNTYAEPFTHSETFQNGTILCVGRFYDTNKRVDRALRVFRIVLDKCPDVKLVLVGPYNLDARIPDGTSPTVSELISNLRFKHGDVTFVGETDDVSPYYCNSAVMIMTTEFEGFPLVLNEAAQHGLPSVIFDISGLDDIIIDGINGHIVPQDDLQGMADKLIDLLSDKKQLNKMRENALEYSKRYDQFKICTRWDALFSMLLSTNSQDEINKRLSEEFIVAPKDVNKFTKTLSFEYNVMLGKIYAVYLESKLENKNVIDSKRYPLIRYLFIRLRKIAEKLKIKEALKKSRLYKNLYDKGVIDELNS